MIPKLFIGPVSKNVVDSVILFSFVKNINIGLIPSRRQIDFNGGYVNDWNTKTFCEYIKSKSNNIVIERDHGGHDQGTINDDGYNSFLEDCKYMDYIHIDPWKSCISFDDGCLNTVKYIKYCYSLNQFIKFEIGTEQSIFQYSPEELNYFIEYVKHNLTDDEYKNIIFVVIQSGTSLKENYNTGVYNENKMIDMINICKKYNLLSKEHNGDYLPTSLIQSKFSKSLDAINIAPEFGQIESITYLKEVKKCGLFNTFFDICYESKKWTKWVDSSFNPNLEKEKLINICGHYVLSNKLFIKEIKLKVSSDIDTIVQKNILSALTKLYDSIY